MQIIALTITRNEEEYIRRCIENSREQGMYPVVVDNGSTDHTQEIVKDMDVPLFEHKTDEYNVYGIIGYGIRRIREMGCDWYMLKDADEIVETYEGYTVAHAVELASSVNRNCMGCDLYEFWPTVDDDPEVRDYMERILHYSFYDAPLTRMVRNMPGLELTGPHIVKGSQNPSNIRLVLRHYKFTGLDQGRRKVKERRERYAKANLKAGSHTQYKHFTRAKKYYVLDKNICKKLHVYDGTWVREQVFDGWRSG